MLVNNNSKPQFLYNQIMRQVKHPLPLSRHQVVCSEEYATDVIGTLYPDNTAWEVIEMQQVERIHTLYEATVT